jgi:molybdopterin synthase catalytic subunit
MVEITESVIDHATLTERVRSDAAGAVVTFLGTVRQFSGGRETASLDYESYPEMAERKMREI